MSFSRVRLHLNVCEQSNAACFVHLVEQIDVQLRQLKRRRVDLGRRDDSRAGNGLLAPFGNEIFYEFLSFRFDRGVLGDE
ncbi:hypothetical protein D3C71_2075090 [compost metagenome]